MILVLINLVGLLVALFFNFVIDFNDAQKALDDGIFSLTSVSGYSVSKSLFLFVSYIFSGILMALFFRLRKKECCQADFKEVVSRPMISSREKIIIAVVIIGVIFLNLFFKETVFSETSLHSEEFINLSASNEFDFDDSFDLAYPYSFGNLIILKGFESLGLELIIYKIILNALALIFAYYCLVALVARVSHRIYSFISFLSFYLYTVLVPTLHRNILRFLLPVFFLFGLRFIDNLKKRENRLAALVALNFLIIFFSSADILVVSYIVYAGAFLIRILDKAEKKDLLIHAASPFIALAAMFLLVGSNLFSILYGQFLSLISYSGHVNATPYFDIYSIFHPLDLADLSKKALFGIIFFGPILILFNILAFLMLSYKKENLKISSSYAFLMILASAYFVYFRQCFGDAGFSRIGIVSVLLFFALMVLLFSVSRAKYVKFLNHAGISFFLALIFVSLYFSRYGLIDLYGQRQKIGGIESCNRLPFSDKMAFAGYEYCDQDLMQELGQISSKINDNDFYVYDDTFSLYYILGSDPGILTPSYNMSFKAQREIIGKMEKDRIGFIIYPKSGHFFGVPSDHMKDENFFKLINEYVNDKFTRYFETDSFLVYKHN